MKFPRPPGATWRCSCAGLLISSALAFADTARSGPTPDVPLPDFGASALRLLGALALVLSLFLGGVWLYRNWRQLGARGGQRPRLQVMEARSLGGRQAIYVIGYEGQRFLVGSSPAGLSFLANLPLAAESESAGETAGAPVPRPSFQESLLAILNRP